MSMSEHGKVRENMFLLLRADLKILPVVFLLHLIKYCVCFFEPINFNTFI